MFILLRAAVLNIVDINGHNIGAMNHKLFCVKRSKRELLSIINEQQSLEVGPYLAKNPRSGLEKQNTPHNAQLDQVLGSEENDIPDLSRNFVGRIME